MKHGVGVSVEVVLSCLLVTVVCFTPTSVYLQAIDRIIQTLVDNIEPADYQVLCEDIEAYNNHAQQFLYKLIARDPPFRKIAIEHCRAGKPEFPDCIKIPDFQLKLGWNDTQISYVSELVNASRYLWMSFDNVCQNETYTRYLDKFTPDF